ncbi:MAG: endopeptidase La [Bacilli bacterium]
MKTNLPVLVLKNMFLFPSSEIRLEFDDNKAKELLSLAENYYDNHLLIVIPKDPFEVDPDMSELPKLGIIGKIKLKMDMPNGKTRVVIRGRGRAKVFAYALDDGIYEAMVSKIEIDKLDPKEELAYMRTLIKNLENYVDNVNYIGNAVVSQAKEVSTLNRLTDVIAQNLQSSIARKIDYINEINPVNRCKMLLDDMNQDLEVINLEKEIDIKLSRELDATQKEFILKEKMRLIKEELGESISQEDELDILKQKITDLNCPNNVKNRLFNELHKLETLPAVSPEVGIIKSYVDWILSLPWSVYTNDNTNLNKVKKILDKTHFGLDKVKDRILEYIAVCSHTKNLKSPIICLVGPPGVGKTSLANSIAKALNRKVTKISVGGINDEAEIVGHRRTYVGALPGKIIQGLKKAGSLNPVFIIDEVDKMTKDIKGDPASSLLEVLDPEQNYCFQDHYIEEEIDLSKVMFILTANYIDQIPDELRDRLEIIEISSYTEYEKLDICKNYIIPNELNNHGLSKKEVIFNDDALMKIINLYTKEAGVRELTREICSILRKIVKNRLLDKNKNKVTISIKNIEEYLGKEKFPNINYNKEYIGFVNGLAYTPYGGDILPIEANNFKGNSNIILTGNLGDILKESASVALDYIKANYTKFGIDYKLFSKDIHIHVPEGAIPKDGPSAGVALVTCIISLLTNTKVSNIIAMTGEITLRGEVLPVGGIKEKIIGAHRNNIKTIFLPVENKKDLIDIPNNIKEDINFIFVKDYMEIYNKVFNNNLLNLFKE